MSRKTQRILPRGSHPFNRIGAQPSNWLTATRIFLVPLVVVIILTKPQFQIAGTHIDNETLGVVVFLLASLTDFLDATLRASATR